jgi:hypothetical protein
MGISFPSYENISEIAVLGGTYKYNGVTGSATTFVSRDHTRWFEITLCYLRFDSPVLHDVYSHLISSHLISFSVSERGYALS